jgi:rRNA maturation endonuclease Nob1
MIIMTVKEYNKEPVVACGGCRSLYLKQDDDDNDICMRCGSINDTVAYNDIEVYKKKNNSIWETI